jgi:hypothetical protein
VGAAEIDEHEHLLVLQPSLHTHGGCALASFCSSLIQVHELAGDITMLIDRSHVHIVIRLHES